MKRTLILSALSGMVLACSQPYITSQGTYQGAAVGAGVGSVAGAMIDSKNRWRGAVIGGVLGAIAGATMTEVAVRSSRQAATMKKPVRYYSEDGRQEVYSEPMGRKGNCTIVRTDYYHEGKLIKRETREVCN
jgi:hypothetical protein